MPKCSAFVITDFLFFRGVTPVELLRNNTCVQIGLFGLALRCWCLSCMPTSVLLRPVAFLFVFMAIPDGLPVCFLLGGTVFLSPGDFSLEPWLNSSLWKESALKRTLKIKRIRMVAAFHH